MSENPPSPPWGGITKAFVAFIGVSLVAALLLRFHGIIPLLVTSGILTYLMLPLVQLLSRHKHISWRMATIVCFFLLILVLIGVSTATGLAAVQQLQALFITVQSFLAQLPFQLEELSQQVVELGPWQLDLSYLDLGILAEQALASLQPILGQVSGLLRSLATVALESLAKLIFVLAVAYFVTLDYARLVAGWSNITLPGYEGDLGRLRQALANIWNRFLRGQLLIVGITGLLTWGLMTILGVRFSMGLGVLVGLSKFVPILGPVTAGGVAALVALFQPANWLGLPQLGYAGLVIAVLVVMDQSIDYLLIPRIMGSSLNLHPVVILVGAIVGASLAGVIGLLLSAPAMATFTLLARYAYRKMTDQPPWDPPIDLQPTALRRPHRLLAKLRSRGRDQAET